MVQAERVWLFCSVCRNLLQINASRPAPSLQVVVFVMVIFKDGNFDGGLNRYLGNAHLNPDFFGLPFSSLSREKVVMVMADGCKLTLPDMSMEQVEHSTVLRLLFLQNKPTFQQVGRLQMKDVPEDKISLVMPFKGQPVDPKVKKLLFLPACSYDDTGSRHQLGGDHTLLHESIGQGGIEQCN